MKTVYADVVFFENFIVDYILLYLSTVSMYVCVKPIKLVLTAVMLSVYSVAVCIVPAVQIVRIIISLLVMLCAGVIILGKRKLKIYIRFCIVVYVFSFLLYGFVESMPLISEKLSGLSMILLLTLFAMFFKRVPEKMLFKCDARYVRTEIMLGKNEYNFLLVCDSGNFLVDPTSNLPVIIVGGCVGKLINMNNYEKRTVPFKTISGEGKMFVITPDRVRIKHNGIWQKVPAVVGMCENLKEETQSADGIFPARLLENL